MILNTLSLSDWFLRFSVLAAITTELGDDLVVLYNLIYGSSPCIVSAPSKKQLINGNDKKNDCNCSGKEQWQNIFGNNCDLFCH